MKRSDTKYSREILEAEAAILRGALRNREGIVIESASEVYERMSLAGQRDLALVLGGRESRCVRRLRGTDPGQAAGGDSLGKPMGALSGNRKLRTRTEGLFLPLLSRITNLLNSNFRPRRETMKLTQLAITTVLAASAAFANEHLTQIRDQAGKLGQEFRDIGVTVKNKNFNIVDVQNRVNAIDADIESLKKSAAEFEAAKHSLTANGDKDWKLSKDIIHLIDIFHEQKSQMLSGEPKKMRSLIQAQAEGLAKRASKLQETSNRLLRTIPAGSPASAPAPTVAPGRLDR